MPTGLIDRVYGKGGTAFFPEDSRGVNAIGLQSSGKLVFIAVFQCEICVDAQQRICRLEASGNGMDASFGDASTPGCKILPTKDNGLWINLMSVQRDDKILVSGIENNRGLLLRLGSEGEFYQAIETYGEQIRILSTR